MDVASLGPPDNLLTRSADSVNQASPLYPVGPLSNLGASLAPEGAGRAMRIAGEPEAGSEW